MEFPTLTLTKFGIMGKKLCKPNYEMRIPEFLSGFRISIWFAPMTYSQVTTVVIFCNVLQYNKSGDLFTLLALYQDRLQSQNSSYAWLCRQNPPIKPVRAGQYDCDQNSTKSRA